LAVHKYLVHNQQVGFDPTLLKQDITLANPQMMPQRFPNPMMMGVMPNMMNMGMQQNFPLTPTSMGHNMFPQMNQDRTSG
jgi:hypothetical protein